MTAERSVYERWAAVMADVKAVGKTGRNTQQNYSFRGIDGVINAAGPAMREHGIIVIPSLRKATYRDVEVGQKRTLMREVTVEVRYTIVGIGGDVFTDPNNPDFGLVPGESMDSGDKGTAKAMSVAYRTFLLQALSIPTDEPDADEFSHERAAVVEDVAKCSLCDELVPGARSDKEPMRVHRVEVHGWTRNEDGTVAPPADPEADPTRPFEEVTA